MTYIDRYGQTCELVEAHGGWQVEYLAGAMVIWMRTLEALTDHMGLRPTGVTFFATQGSAKPEDHR